MRMRSQWKTFFQTSLHLVLCEVDKIWWSFTYNSSVVTQNPAVFLGGRIIEWPTPTFNGFRELPLFAISIAPSRVLAQFPNGDVYIYI